MNMNDNELENLAKTLGLSEEETGKLWQILQLNLRISKIKK
jgi:hypothetical protein